jgi:hypothetical protein
LVLDPNEKGVPNNILVLLCAQLINGKYVPAQRELIIGCASVGSGSKRVGVKCVEYNKIILCVLF